MNPTETGFEGIQLENSILCKHNKIAGRVETIFCEADPIRLNDFSPLKRLGPGCCKECHQYNCVCLWEKHAPVKSNETDSSDVCTHSQTKWSPFEKSMLYRLRKRNLYCGNMTNTNMQWVMKPVANMRFTESDNSSIECKGEMIENDDQPDDVQFLNNYNGLDLKRVRKLHGSKASVSKRSSKSPRSKIVKTPNKGSLASTKDNLEESSKMDDETLGKIHKSARTTHMKQQQSKPSLSSRAKLNSNHASSPKKDTLANLNCYVPVSSVKITAKRPKSPKSKQITQHDYVDRINDIISSRCMFANQKVWTSDIPFPANLRPNALEISQTLSYTHRYNHKGIQERSKTSEFLLHDTENRNTKFARTIDSLEDMQHGISTAQNLTKDPCIATPNKNNILFDKNEKNTISAMTINKESSPTYHKSFNLFNPMDTECRIRIVRGEEKSFKNVAVQTEESNFNLMLTKPQPTTVYEDPPSGSKQKYDENKQYKKGGNDSILETNILADKECGPKTTNDFNRDALLDAMKDTDRSLSTKVTKDLAKVKRIAALFEAEILAHTERAKSLEPKIRNARKIQNVENLNLKSATETSLEPKAHSNTSQEANDVKSKDSGIGSDRVIPIKEQKMAIVTSESYSECSVVTVVSKKKDSEMPIIKEGKTFS